MSKPRETWHVCEADEDVQWAAVEYGIKDWEAVYRDPKNKELVDKGRDPHVLFQGDKVWIPDPKPKVFEAETDKRHQFVLHTPKQLIQLVLESDEGEPYGNRRYEIWIKGKRYDPPGSPSELRTRDDGLVHQLVPLERDIELRAWLEEPNAQHEQEELVPSPDDPEEFDYVSIKLNPAHLDPIDTIEGIQDRLTNLGYSLDDPWGKLGDSTRDAITRFQHDVGLIETGEVDPETRKRLLETAGS